MDYSSDYSQSSPQRVWPPNLLTPQQTQQQQQPQHQQQQPGPFPSPVSPGTFFFPAQTPAHQQQPGVPQTSLNDSRSGLSLNLAGVSVASPPSLSPIAPHQAQPGQLHPHQFHAHHSIPHQPHHSHSHSHSSASSISGPITPVSPPSMPLLTPQPQFSFNFDDPSGGLSPTLDPALRPTSSHSASCSEFVPEKSVPRKRSLTNALPTSSSATTPAHCLHQHSQSHSYSSSQSQAAHPFPHPIITTTASSPPLTSSASSPSSHPSHSHSRSLSHSHSHSSLSQSHSPQPPQPHIDMNANPSSPYDDLDIVGNAFAGIGDDASDDDLGSPSGGNANFKSSGSSQHAQNVMGKSGSTNNFVTKLHNMINDTKSQHFISWTDSGASFVVSNVSEFSRNILGSHFKHNNFSSFVRQLNMYGFHKINRTPRAQRTSSTSQTWEFSHPKFLRGRADLLDAIKRRALEPDPKERSRVELPGEVKRLLSELREENRALWRELRALNNRTPHHVLPAANQGLATISPNFGGSAQGSQSHMSSTAQVDLGGGHNLTHSRSSSNLGGDDGDRDIEWEDEDALNASVMSGIAISGSQGDEWNAQSPDFNFGINSGFGAPGFAFGSLFGEEWKRWAEGEIMREKRRVERLVCVVKALVERGGTSVGGGAAMGTSMEPDGIPPSILQELHELSLTFDTPSPISGPIPSPSPSPSPHPFTRHQHSPNIFITSPTSPAPCGLHSRPASRESQTHSNPNATLPTLSILNPGPSHSATSSSTVSDFVPNFFNHKPSHARSLSHLGVRTRQPNIMLTLDTDDAGHVEKRARTEVENGKEGLSGEQMDVEVGDDAKLPSPISLTGGTPPTTNVTMCIGTSAAANKLGLRSRSDSAPMWGGDGSSVQGGLSANWTGRGRSGNSFGQ